MSCYFRHMDAIFTEAGITVTKENRKRVDEAIHHIMDVEYKNCSPTWAKIKKEVLSNTGKRRDFIAKLKSELARS